MLTLLPTPGSAGCSRRRPPGGTPGYEEAEGVATRELEEYFHGHIAERRGRLAAGEPVPDDYTTMMLTATHDGRRLTDDESHQVLQLC